MYCFWFPNHGEIFGNEIVDHPVTSTTSCLLKISFLDVFSSHRLKNMFGFFRGEVEFHYQPYFPLHSYAFDSINLITIFFH